jgi:hypothetical protein
MAFIIVVENEQGEVVDEVPRSCDDASPDENDRIEMAGAIYKVHRVVFAEDDTKTTRRKYLSRRIYVRPLDAASAPPREAARDAAVEPGSKPAAGRPRLQALPPVGNQTSLIREYFTELGADESEIELLCLLRQEIDWQDELGDRMAALRRVQPGLFVECTDPEVIRARARDVKFQFTELCLQLDARCRAARASTSVAR